MPNLNEWRLSVKLAWRDLGAGKVKFLFAILAVSVGVAALSGVRGYCAAFQEMLLRDARTLLAGDLSASINHEPDEDEQAVLASLVGRGATVTRVTELMTMMGGHSLPRPLAVNLKAVDPSAYPFYGEVELAPSGSLQNTLADDVVLASQDLLVRLQAEVGDQVRLGEADFRIAAIVLVEPDRMTGAVNFGPRAMLSRDALERTGLVQFGSRVSRRFLVKLPSEGMTVDEARQQIDAGIEGSRITDYRESSPRIRRGLDRTTSFLSLVSLLAMAVGGLGVAMVVYSHLQQRLDTIAIMKCYGATSGLIIRVFLLQTVALGLLGSILGVGIGFLAQGVAPTFVADYFPQAPSFDWQLWPAVQATGVGLLTVLMFSLPTLLGIRKVAPALIFRREMATRFERTGGERRRELLRQLSQAAIVMGGIGLVAAWLGDSTRLGAWFAGGLAISLAALALTAGALLRTLKAAPALLPFRLPVGLRHGIANLHRPGMHTEVILIALGIGVTFTLTVYLLQTTVLAQLIRNAPPDMPNVYLSNITANERGPLESFLRQQAGIEGDVTLLPVVSARLESFGGGARNPGRRGERGSRMRRTRDITWADEPPKGLEVLQGRWWDPAQPEPVVSVRDRLAEYMDIRLGSDITWQVGGRDVTAQVVAIHSFEGMPDWIYDFVLNEGALQGSPATYIGGIRALPEYNFELSRKAFEAFPSVLYVSAVDFFETVQEVVDQIAFVIRFVSAFAIAAGVIILVSSVAATRFRRMREVAILKTLGATRNRLTEIFSIEFLIVGGVAGAAGSLLAVSYSALLTRDILDLDAVIELPAIAITVIATALIATCAGWGASFRILGNKPLEILRDE